MASFYSSLCFTELIIVENSKELLMRQYIFGCPDVFPDVIGRRHWVSGI